MTKNVTLRIRAIGDSDLEAVLEMLENVSKRVMIVDSHSTDERPPTAAEAKAPRIVKSGIDLTNGDVNYGPVPCPICNAVDDHPCKYTFDLRKKHPNERTQAQRVALQGSDKREPHKQRLAANERPLNSKGIYKCHNVGCSAFSGTWSEANDHKRKYFPQSNLHMIYEVK